MPQSFQVLLVHADYKKGEDGVRSLKNGINPNVTIHRLYGAVRMGGRLYRVKVTLKENTRTKETPKAYSYEATKIELLEGPLSQTESSHNLEPNNSKSEVSAGQHGNVSGLTSTFPRYSDKSITAAKLLYGVEKSYGGGKFFEEYNRIRKQFIGEKGAAAADHAEEVGVRLDILAVVREMEGAGKDAKAIKMATGWERGADGKWRYEIPDSKLSDMTDVDGKGTMVKRHEEDMLWTSGKLGDVVDAPELFKAYPELKNVRLETDTMMNDLPSNGEFSPSTNTITIHSDNLKYLNSILNHEIQHAIQHIEGFARGGNPEYLQWRIEAAKKEWRAHAWADALRDKAEEIGEHYNQVEVEKALIDEYKEMGMDNDEWMPDKETRIKGFNYFARGYADRSFDDDIRAFRLNESTRSDYNPYVEYTKLGGEAEARNVQARMGMNDEERRASLVAETEDVAREDQIFLQDGLNGVSESREPSIWLPKDEYAKVAHVIATNKDLKKAGMNEVFTDNNYYIYTAKKNGDFIVRFGLPIEGNEDIINELSKGVEDGTIRNTRSLYSVIERERSKQNENNYNYVNAEGRQKSTGAIGNLALRQQADSTGSDGYLGEEIPGRTPAGNSDRGAGREAGGISDSNLYRQSEITPHAAISSESKSQAVQKATENLNLGGRVVVHESAEGLEGKEATAKGWYDTQTGQIHVVLSNNADAANVTQTILHEAVAHHGLRELFGHNVMDAFLDSVLAAASQEVKDAINELRRGNGWNFRTATEEYLAGLAERTDFERMTAEERGLFATIRRLFNHALEFLGLKSPELSDRELAYILWCSYQDLQSNHLLCKKS